MRTTSFFAFDRIPDTAKIYVTNRLTEVIGAGLVIGVLAAALSLVTWSAQDPTLNYAHDGAVRNLLGAPGALMGDLIMQIWGMSALALLTPVAIWGWHLMAHHRLDRFVGRITFLFCGSACTAALASLLPVTANWPMPTGLGGVVGDAMITLPRILIDGAHFGSLVSALVFAVGAIIALSAAASPVARKISPDEIESRTSKHRNQVTPESADEVNEPGVALVSLGAITHAVLSLKARLFRYISRPVFFSKARKIEPTLSYSRKEPSFPGSVSISQRATVQVASDHVNEAPLDLRNDKIVIGPTPAKIKIGVRAAREAQPSLLEVDTFELPPLALLMEPKRTNAGKLSAESLEQNARLLEGVLDDFGVKEATK
jgi:S-DNA-T family DNA segregation ATPase FtsK/SpoIIIE